MKPFVVAALLLFTAHAAEAQCTTPSQLDTDLTGASLGQVISLAGVSPLNCPDVSMSGTWSAGKLIFSDSPESPTSTGKLYKDSTLAATSGTAYNRIFSYHVNNVGSTKRMVVVLKNLSASSGTLTIQKKGVAGPTTSFAYAGKLAFQRWIDSSAASGVSVAAGATVHIDSTFNTTNVANGNLYHGIWDYSFTQAHEVNVCILNTNENPLTKCVTANVLARDSHDRGTFDYADKIYDTGISIDTADDIVSFTIGSGNGADDFITGLDNAVANPTSETLQGNFGVVYRMHLQTEATDSRNLGLLVNPRAGGWGGAARVMAGLLPTTNTTFLLPPGSGTSSDNTKASVLGRWSPNTGLNVWVQFMPTGGSSFPVRVIAVPH